MHNFARGIVEIVEQEGMVGALDNIRSFASEAEVHRLRARVAELEANASSVRDEALREAAEVSPCGEFIDSGGWHAGYACGCRAKTDAIRALISSPPSAPPADVTRALEWTWQSTFSGPKDSVTVDFKDLSVDLHSNTPPEAARAFWNAVMSVVGKPPLFPEEKK